MKRNAVAVAVGALFIAPAAQAQIVFGNETIGTVQFYGKLYPQLATAKSTGATAVGSDVSTLVSVNGILPASTSAQGIVTANGTNAGSRNSVDSSNSNLGFRGERRLGGAGLKAIWQVEQQINLETGTGTFSNRNTFVGLNGAFGTVKLGNMDTVYKDYGDTFSMLGVSSGNFVSASNVLSHIGVGNVRAARFHERRPNALTYETPQFRGITAGVMYGPDEARGNSGSTTDANLYSYGVKYDSEMFYVSLAQERHNDFFGGSNNIPAFNSTLRNGSTSGTTGAFTPGAGAHSRDVATRLSGEIRLGIHRLVGDIARLEYKESGQTGAGKFDTYKHTNWAIGWEARWGGPWRTAIQYIQGGEGTCSLTGGVQCSTTGLKGTQLNFGVGYSVDRQTMLFALASRLTNDKSAMYDNWDATDPGRGGDITQMAIGISYTF